MNQATNNVTIRGVVTARQPLMHVGNTDGNTAYAITASVPCAAPGEVVRVPIIQGSSYRGALRDKMATILAEAYQAKGGMLDLDLATRLFNGGKLQAKATKTIEERNKILEVAPDLRLFGGIDRVMFPSPLKVCSLYPICGVTIEAGIVPGDYRSLTQGEIVRTERRIVRRRDEVLDGDANVMRFFDDDGLEAVENYIQTVTDEKADDGKREHQQHIGTVEVIPAGTRLYSEIHILGVDDVALGLAFLMLERFFADGRAYLGGGSRAGYGLVSANYSLSCDDGTESIQNFITANDDGTHTLSSHGWVCDKIEAFERWADETEVGRMLKAA